MKNNITLLRHGQVLLTALVTLLSGMEHARAENRPKIEIVPVLGHSAVVLSVAFSPDGTRVLSGSWDHTMMLWDTATGALIRTFEGHSGGVSSVAFSPSGNRVLSGSWDGTIKLWEAPTGALIRTFKDTGAVNSVAFSPDGARMLSGSDDKTIKLWDVGTGALIRTFEGHSDRVRSVTFSPDADRVLSGSSDKTIRLWNAATGEPMRIFKGHSGVVVAVAFSPEGGRVLSGSEDKTINLWDAASGGLIRTFTGHADRVWSVVFLPDGGRVLSGSGDETIKLWDAATGGLIRTFRGHVHPVTSLAFLPDGNRVLSGGYDHTIKLWDGATGALIRTFEGRSDQASSVAVSPDGGRILSSSRDRTIKLWDAPTGALIRTLDGHSSWVRSVAFSPDGTRVLSGSWDHTIKLWEAATGALTRTFEGHSDGIWSVAYSPDGGRVLSGSEDKSIKLWDAATGALIRTFQGHSGRIASVAFSPDGGRVLSGSYDKTVRLWDAATGALIRTFDGSDFVDSVAFSPDGRRVLSGGGDIKLWDAATGALIRTFKEAGGVNSVAFSADGGRVLSASYHNTIRLWDVATGALIRTFEGHSGWVQSVAFSPDGARVLSGGSAVRIWNLATGKLIGSLIGSRDGEWLAVTPEGFFAASPSDAKVLSVVRGLDVSTVGQLHQSLFNPDLVRESLAHDPQGEVREASTVMNLEKVLDSGPAPVVAITSHPSGSALTEDVVAVKARITDKGKGIGRIEWRVNGVTAAVSAKPTGGGPDYDVTRQLALDPGENTIEVVAYNGSNLLASLPARTKIRFTGAPATAKPNLYILAIGINKYVDTGWKVPGTDEEEYFSQLTYAVADATAFAEEMKKAGEGLYGKVTVRTALDEQATRANLDGIVQELSGEIKPRDTFVFFAAGHGYSIRQSGRFFLIPQDHQGGTNPKALTSQAIGQELLQEWIANRIKAKKAIILLDTCRSGALTAGYTRSRIDEKPSEAGVGRLHEATGRPVLTAAAAGEDALEVRKLGHGVFTTALIDALHHGDRDGDGLIEVSELASYVEEHVPKLADGSEVRAAITKRGPGDGGRQSAHFGSTGGDYALASRLP
jgi:WD40 repeat protein